MADADLDVVIRQLAKQQHKTLMAAVKSRRDRYAALAARAKDAESKQRYRQLAKDAFEIGTATVKRMQMSADNAAYSYSRSIRQAVETSVMTKPPSPAEKSKTSPPSGKKVAKTATRKAAKKV